jgi:Flp pilus assembly protein TadG
MKKRNRSNQKRGGALTVEVAIVLPILLTFLFACYELSRANMIRHGTESAAYEGARTGIVPGATQQSIENSTAFVLRSIGISDFTVTVTPAVITNTTETVTVEVAVPFRTNTNIPEFFVGDPTFRATCTLGRETL